MSAKKENLKDLIQGYLVDEKLFKENISNSKLNFSYIFTFPPGGLKSHQMNVFQPKNQNYIQIAIRTQLSKNQIETLKSLKNNKGIQFFNDIRKYFIVKEVYFKIDIQNFIYEILEQIFPNRRGLISKNDFFKGIRKVFYCYLFSNLLLGEYCLGKDQSSTSPNSEFDVPLYS